MKIHKLITGFAFLLVLASGSAQAADEPPAEITMIVIEEGESVDRVLAPIELPDFSSEDTGTQTDAIKENAEDSTGQVQERIKDAVGRGALNDIPENVRDNMPEIIDGPNEQPNEPPSEQPGTNPDIDPANGGSA